MAHVPGRTLKELIRKEGRLTPERAERFKNELIVAAHVTSRDEPTDFQRWVTDRLPAGLRERVQVWGA